MKFTYIQQFFFFGLLLITTGVFIWMLGKYLFPVFWAVVIAIIFYPIYLRILKKFKGRASLASLATLVVVMLVMLLPLALVGTMVAQESLSLYERVSSEENGTSGFDFFNRTEFITSQLEQYGISQSEVEDRVRGWISNTSQTVASSLFAVGQGTASFLISFVIMLYVLFFFFRDGVKLKKTIIHYLPFGGYEDRLFSRFTETTHAVVKGTLIISILQGVIGGVAFWLVGVPNPVLWGVAMGIFAILPGIGTPVVWLPVAIVLMFTGSILAGIIIVIVGIFFISLIDEFLRPTLVGRGAKMPDALVLLATIGGLATFGVTGFVAGPVLAAFFLSLWTVFEERYHQELSADH